MKKNLKQFMAGTLLALTLCSARVALAGERGGNGVFTSPTIDAQSLLCQKIGIQKKKTIKFLCSDVRGFEYSLEMKGSLNGLSFPLASREFKVTCPFFKANDFIGTHTNVKVSSSSKKKGNGCIVETSGSTLYVDLALDSMDVKDKRDADLND